jgi:hypothetical protein
MSNKWRRYEVLLPLKFNDGSDIPGELLADAVLEVVDHFGAASYELRRWKDIGGMAGFSTATT